MRNLASVVTVKTKQKMFEKDKICCVSFEELGYEAIVPNTVNVGDKLAFIQEGSILPEINAWEFLRKRCYSEKFKGFIIRPMIMGAKETETGEKGDRVKSWGLAVGLDELPITDEKVRSKLKPGDDLTDLLGIRKYEPEEDASPKGDSKKAYPKWVKFCLGCAPLRWIGRIWQKNHQNSAGGFPTPEVQKSDETTVQNMPNVLEKFADDWVYVSAKLEGQSGTTAFDVVRDGDDKIKKIKRFYVCSRNNAYKLKCNNDFWTWCVSNDIERKLVKYYKETGKLLIIQAEQCGPGIQNNIYNLKNITWFVYLMEDMATHTQLTLDEMLSACKALGIHHVPIIERDVKLKDIMPDIKTAVNYAENQYWVPITGEGDYRSIDPFYKPRAGEKLWKDYFQHEGVVVRSLNCDKMKNIGTSFKVKNVQYSEKNLGEIAKSCQDLKLRLKN